MPLLNNAETIKLEMYFYDESCTWPIPQITIKGQKEQNNFCSK